MKLPLKLQPIEKQEDLKSGDLFLWKGSGGHEIHAFHSDAGYGIKTYTEYNEKNGSSIIVRWSGLCGKLIIDDSPATPLPSSGEMEKMAFDKWPVEMFHEWDDEPEFDLNANRRKHYLSGLTAMKDKIENLKK